MSRTVFLISIRKMKQRFDQEYNWRSFVLPQLKRKGLRQKLVSFSSMFQLLLFCCCCCCCCRCCSVQFLWKSEKKGKCCDCGRRIRKKERVSTKKLIVRRRKERKVKGREKKWLKEKEKKEIVVDNEKWSRESDNYGKKLAKHGTKWRERLVEVCVCVWDIMWVIVIVCVCVCV